MHLALMLLAAYSPWAPARWHSTDPRSLELLRGTPINCLLLERAAWDPAFLAAARSQNVVTLGVVHPGDRMIDEAREAVASKMDGVVLEGEFDAAVSSRLRAAVRNSGLVVIDLPNRRSIRLDSEDPIVGTWQGLWPGIEIEHGGKALTGPSSAPWVFTNTGFLRFLRAATEGQLWIGVSPPPKTVYPLERYAEAIGDAALAGARWIVALDADFERRLWAHEPEALKDWRRLSVYMNYFDRPEWADYRPFSTLAVVQDSDSGGLLSGSLLDMMSTQRTPVRVIPTRRLNADRLRGIHTLLNVNPDALSPAQKLDVEAFQKAGGQILNPPAGWRFPPTSAEQVQLNRRQLDQMQGIWEVTYHATVRKNFGARTFNTTGMQSSVLARGDGKSIAVHLLNYTEFPVESVTVQALGVWKRARLFSPDGTVRNLPVYSVKDGTGVDIEQMGTVATVVLD